jgi:hypothetical protein
MGRSTTRRCGMCSTMRLAMPCCCLRASCGSPTSRSAIAAGSSRRWFGSTILGTKIAAVSTPGDISSASATAEAMIAPTMAIAPACPRPDAEENSVIEITRPVETHRCASIRRIVVVAVFADRRIDADDDLCAPAGHDGHRRQQNCCTGQQPTTNCVLAKHPLDLPHFVTSWNFLFDLKVVSPLSSAGPEIADQ